MKRLFAALLLTCIAAPAYANCNPPPGLTIQQFHYVCNADLVQAYYSGGYAQRMNPMQFEIMAYQYYLRQTGGGGPPMSSPSPAGLCPLGATRCRGGWLDVCQRNPSGATWWVTGSAHCGG